MGICTSVPKGDDSKARRRFVASPVKEKKVFNGENPVASFVGNPGFGSKEEYFFDSRAWLDSDCEDDFFSVKGDFTPSRGSTPIHPLSSPSTPRLERDFFFHKSPADSQSEPSPTGRRKLADLLQEMLQSERADLAPNAGDVPRASADEEQPSKSPNRGTMMAQPYHRSGASSVCGDEETAKAAPASRKEKAWKSSHCCLPRLQTLGLVEGHKMSPRPCAA